MILDKILSYLGLSSAGALYGLARGYSLDYLDPELDVALVTGGSNGLGAATVKRLRAKRIPVVVLDVIMPEDQLEGVYYVKCDISSLEQVLDAAEVIKREIGDVTILINNAAIAQGKSLLDLSYEEIDKCLEVNLHSQFYTVKAFLPGMLKLRRGYVVIVSSVIAYIGPVKLSAYAASKSGLLGLYEALTYEVGANANVASGVRTLLVVQGQMTSSLFEGVVTRHKIVAPVLDTRIVADRILLALSRGEQGKVALPVYAKLVPLVRVLPRFLLTPIRSWSGIDRGMTSFLGNGVSEHLLGPRAIVAETPEDDTHDAN
ncbi:uncharacterized protein V1518DRAFT_419129 [Limtongia smithiae]|uniref:uncharacterized protein n=1 Tax=Limtongia smithiae TaxID=1125753 RepID=UPI0034CDC98C